MPNPTSITTLVALLVCLAPTTIGALLSAIGIAGMSRLNQANVLAMSGRAIEAAGDVDILMLDKTGTITLGNRQACDFVPVDWAQRDGIGRRGAACFSLRRDAGGPQRCGAGQRDVRHPRTELSGQGDDLHSLHGRHPHERRGL